MTSADFKAELLATLQEEMADIFKVELKTAMSDNFNQVKSDLQSVSTKLNANMAAIQSDVDVLRQTVVDMEGSLSSCTDNVVSLKSKADTLLAQVAALDSKCEDRESRSRGNNIRIIGLREEHGPVDATTISILLKDVLGLGKDQLWTARTDLYNLSQGNALVP